MIVRTSIISLKVEGVSLYAYKPLILSYMDMMTTCVGVWAKRKERQARCTMTITITASAIFSFVYAWHREPF